MENIKDKPPINLFRLPISGVDTVEDTDKLAERIIHEWKKTRDEWRPNILMVDLNVDLHLYRILKAEGLPVSALPEDESRNRHAAHNRRYHPNSCRNAQPGSQSPDAPAGSAAKQVSKTHPQPDTEEMECSKESAAEHTVVPSRHVSEGDTLRVRKRPIQALNHMMTSFLVWCGVKKISLENDRGMARRLARTKSIRRLPRRRHIQLVMLL
ncbi:hypothetical protein HZ994_09525 [Akkermansiaceae bacterium]|nr:hypothetical protein HZ994_09525 [Akkermansiaceae bacterium]